MFCITEEISKDWIRKGGCPVPLGHVARTPHEAEQVFSRLARPAVIKALIPTGRRGHAGAILEVVDGRQAADAAKHLIGSCVNGHEVSRVLVEENIGIAKEIYLAFSIGTNGIEMISSAAGGVEIEEIKSSLDRVS